MAIKTYKKGTSVTLSANFKSTEFDCQGSGCCSSTIVDEKLVEYLQKIRDHFGKPVNINSGYRCATHNASVGGATKSNHMDGKAADIRISGVTPLEVAQYAEHIGILGIGVYSWGVHIDTRASKYFWYDGGESNVKTFGNTFQEEKKEEIKVGTTTTTKEMYRVRKSWDNAKSQVGAYSVLQNAKNACNKAGAGYYVFDSKGEIVYPVTIKEEVKPNTGNTNTTTDPKKMWDYFKSKGLSDAGVAGLMGNLYAESSLNPRNLQNSYEKKLGYTDASYTAAVDNGTYTNFVHDSAGYGLAQWTFWSLKQDMLNYIKAKNKSIGDLDAQMEFLAYELSTQFKSVWKILCTTNNIKEASNAVLLQFERPADQSVIVQNKRAEYGQGYYNKYAKQNASSAGVSTTKMKYNENNKPFVCMMKNSTCYKQTRTMTPLGILWHSTGCNNPTLKRYVQPHETDANYYEMIALIGKNQYKNDWNHIDHQAGLNAWIGKLADGTVTTVQTMPWNYRPWGCGSGAKGSCNSGWIQFEICEDDLTNPQYFETVYKEACELTAYLCKLYNIDPFGTVKQNGVNVPTILCHADSYKLGFGSNHGDVLHWFPKYGKSMETVRKDVYALMQSDKIIVPPVTTQPEIEEEEEMTQEQFNTMMNAWIADQAKKAPGDWSAEAREWGERNDLINGDASGNKMYKKLLTREEFISVLYRALHRNILD